MPFLIPTILLVATGAVANLMAGKYQAFFYYQVYLLDVKAHGLANCHLAPLCAKDGIPGNPEEFLRHLSIIKTEYNGGEITKTPDFTKVNWARIGEPSDITVFGEELEKSGFGGTIDDGKMFMN